MSVSAYRENGFALIEKLLTVKEIIRLTSALDQIEEKPNNYGIRNLMNRVPSIRKLATSTLLMPIVHNVLGEQAKPVRAVYFNKTEEANWNVAWHQDTSIAVSQQADVEGFGTWSIKQGVPHTEPPFEYLKNMLTLRIHLDRANSESGVLRVIPATHSAGRIKSSEILKIVESKPAIECYADPGDVLLMNPLLLHSSRKATAPTQRRIIHIEYSAMELPPPLQWHEA